MRWLLLLALLLPSIAQAQVFAPFKFSVASSGASCTDGVDCLCDTISPSSTLIYCEDFESLDYYENTSNDFVSSSGTDRGNTSRWYLKHSNGVQGSAWAPGTPASPRIAPTCVTGSLVCVGTKEYCSTAQGNIVDGGGPDCWQANSTAFIDIQRTGDAADEIGSIALSGGHGEGTDVGGGRAHLAQRNTAGATGGKHGVAAFKNGGGGTVIDHSDYTEIGITMMIAYSANIFTETDSTLDGPWKDDEWGGSDLDGGLIEHWNLGALNCTDLNDNWPYMGWMANGGFVGGSSAGCVTALAGATEVVGDFSCTSTMLALCATSAYSRTTDFPPETWACHQAHIKGMGTTDMEVTVKHNGVTVFQLDGFDATIGVENQYYSGWTYNNYANINEDGNGTTNDTDVSMFRYKDEIVVVNGPPEPCSAIGM